MDDLLTRPQVKLLPFLINHFYQATLAQELLQIKSNYEVAMLQPVGRFKYFVLYPSLVLSLLMVIYGRDLIVAYRARPL